MMIFLLTRHLPWCVSNFTPFPATNNNNNNHFIIIRIAIYFMLSASFVKKLHTMSKNDSVDLWPEIDTNEISDCPFWFQNGAFAMLHFERRTRSIISWKTLRWKVRWSLTSRIQAIFLLVTLSTIYLFGRFARQKWGHCQISDEDTSSPKAKQPRSDEDTSSPKQNNQEVLDWWEKVSGWLFC